MLPFEFLGPYRIGESIGRGGMGTVYRGVHEKSGQPVAVKLIGHSVADDPRFRRRFAGEIETLKRLKHPNIVSLIGYGEQAGQLFYSMELVDGESLQQRLRREKRLPWPPVLDMAIEICAALKHAHDFGVVHRDLKPANLLITESGSVKLVDFGIAKLFGNNDQTAAGSVLGTADFMAPEQAGEGSISPRTDLYALGNVMYACFAGRPPFAGRTLTKVIESLRQDTPARIDLINPELPTEIVELIHDLLEKRPEDRPPTALAVMNRMKAIRAGLNRLATQIAIEGDTIGPAPNRYAVNDDDIKPTAISSLDEKTLGQFDDGSVTAPRPIASDQLTVAVDDASRLGTESHRKPFKQDDKHPTVPSAAARSVVPPRPTQPTTDTTAPQPSTHFRTVEDQERRRGLLDASPAEEDQPSRLWQLLSIVAMIAVLGSGVAAFIYALRKPGPDELYEMIMQARESDDTDAFRARTDQFLRLYEKDPRRNELVVALEEMDAYQVIRKLRSQAARAGGVDQLPSEEQAFLLAMKDRRQDPQSTQTRLRQWLAIYAPGGQSIVNPSYTVSRQVMIRAAENEVKRLEDTSPTPGDQRVSDLIARMDWGAENLQVDDQQELLRGVIALFEEKLWAKNAVEEAKNRLAELDH
jgi:serine/threonine-protein kinase